MIIYLSISIYLSIYLFSTAARPVFLSPPPFPRRLWSSKYRRRGNMATQGASLTDLREDEKLKIGNLLRELARSQREAQQASNDRQEYASRLQRMRVQNDSIIQVR